MVLATEMYLPEIQEFLIAYVEKRTGLEVEAMSTLYDADRFGERKDFMGFKFELKIKKDE